jgi:hypothetical protein
MKGKDNMEIITRKEARNIGLTHYYTGKPCLHGHLHKRTVTDSTCLECVRIKSSNKYSLKYHQEWRKKNPNYNQEWQRKNPNYSREWQRKNRLKIGKPIRQRIEKPIKEKIVGRISNSYAQITNFIGRNPRSKPKWITRQDFYDVWIKCPIGYEMDHIVPLNGYYIMDKIKIPISGLSVPWNVQYLTRSQNASKKNKLSSEDYRIACSLEK